jgi:hypothetical protein
MKEEGEEQLSSSLHTFSPKEWLIVCHKVRMTKLHIPGIDFINHINQTKAN